MFQFLQRKRRDRMARKRGRNRQLPRHCRLVMEGLERRHFLAGDAAAAGDAIDFVDQSVANAVPTTLDEFKEFAAADYDRAGAVAGITAANHGLQLTEAFTDSITREIFLNVDSLPSTGLLLVRDDVVTGSVGPLGAGTVSLDGAASLDGTASLGDIGGLGNISTFRFSEEPAASLTSAGSQANWTHADIKNRLRIEGESVGNVKNPSKIIFDSVANPVTDFRETATTNGSDPLVIVVRPIVDASNHPARLTLSDFLEFESADAAPANASTAANPTTAATDASAFAATGSQGFIDVATLVTKNDDPGLGDKPFFVLFEPSESSPAALAASAPARATPNPGESFSTATAMRYTPEAAAATVPLSGTRGRSQAFEMARADVPPAGSWQHGHPATFDMARSHDDGAGGIAPKFGASSQQTRRLAAASAVANESVNGAVYEVASLLPADVRFAAADAVFERIGTGDGRRLGYVYTEQASPLFMAIAVATGLMLVRGVGDIPDGRDRLWPKPISLRSS